MFFQILFSCNNISILGKPKGKEKQDNLEYDVSKATALWFYQDLQSHSPGGTACWVPAGGFNSTTPTIMGRLQSTIKTPLPSVLNFFHLSNKRASEIFKRRFKEKKKVLTSGSGKAANWTEAEPPQTINIHTEMLHETHQKNSNSTDT